MSEWCVKVPRYGAVVSDVTECDRGACYVGVISDSAEAALLCRWMWCAVVWVGWARF